MCLLSSEVTIQWENTTYTVSEDSGTVELVLLKVGETTFSASVEITTIAVSATGRYINTYVYSCFQKKISTPQLMKITLH